MVLSHRIRLARNLASSRFGRRPSRSERETVMGQVTRAAQNTSTLGRAMALRVDSLETQDRQLLLERHLISRELAAIEGPNPAFEGGALLLQDNAAVMVNEEDHLR